jgi:hypothetical protein
MLGLLAVACLLVLLLATGPAWAERARNGNLIVALNGGVSPLQLPRHRQAPVAVHLSGLIETADGSPLPRLTGLELQLAGSGLLSSRGLADCPGARLRNADSHQALNRCRDALVGTGTLEALVFLPSQGPFTVHTRLLAFNGHAEGGRKAIWVHAFSYEPPISLAVPFLIEHRPGAFQTVLIAPVEASVGPFPRLARFELTLSRRFTYRRVRHSYLSASCPVPHPFTAGFLTFARASYSFDEVAAPVSVEAVRSCRAA